MRSRPSCGSLEPLCLSRFKGPYPGMKVPTGIIAFGNSSFSGWLAAHIERTGSFTYSGSCDQVVMLEGKVAGARPRAVIVDLDGISSREAAAPGILAQRGFKWTSVLFIFSSLDKDVVAFSKSVRRRKWSLAGRGLVDQVGIDRVLAGALTQTGLIDSTIAAYETAMHEKSLEAGNEASGEGDEEAA